MKISNLNIPVSDKNAPRIVPTEFPLKTSDNLFCRDPYILLYGDSYYLYRSAQENGVECLVSKDLENWSEPIPVFIPPEDFHGCDDFFWAPECHYYKGNFYIFTSVQSRKYGYNRVISVYRANNPLGPFEDIADGRVSPANQDSIDGTLYVDEDGQPWMLFVHEWTSMPDDIGAMSVAKLSDDLSHLISEPIDLFKANDPSWTDDRVTDGPYVYVSDEGKMLMIWSNFTDKGYCIGIAHSESSKITGPWIQHDKLIYEKGMKDEFIYGGGHAMIFKAKDGRLMLSFHSPNSETNGVKEHLTLMELEEKDGELIIK